MILLAAALFSLGLAWLRGGDLLRLGKLSFRLPFMIFAGLLLQVVVFSSWGRLLLGDAELVGLVHVASLALVALAAGLNHRLPGLKFIGAGLLMNLLVIAANGGYMPVHLDSIQAAGFGDVMEILARGETYEKSIVLDERTRLGFLADVFAVPKPLPLSGVFSPGDVVVSLGVFWFFQEIMVARPPKPKP